ncbi:MAG: hypothetical protein D6731_14335 [Planctomycetota bacterium]|nr:MAG: hypothetical protein D6731_14335 [Planctomycetota bacterium]
MRSWVSLPERPRGIQGLREVAIALREGLEELRRQMPDEGPLRSVAELCLSSEQFAVLDAFARSWSPTLVTVSLRNAGRPNEPVHDPRWLAVGGYWNAFGLVFLVLAAEVARREAEPGEVWPPLARRLPEAARSALFWGEQGALRQEAREAMADAGRAFGLRNAFNRSERQCWYATVQLQFGIGRHAFDLLPDYLNRTIGRPSAVDALLDTSKDSYSRSFARVHRALQKLWGGQEVSDERLLEGGWLLPEWLVELRSLATHPLPRRTAAASVRAPAPRPPGGPRVEAPSEPAPAPLVESMRLEWKSGGSPCWRVELNPPNRLGLRFVPSVATVWAGTSRDTRSFVLRWVEARGRVFRPVSGDPVLRLPALRRIWVGLCDREGALLQEQCLEPLSSAGSFALVPLPSGRVFEFDERLPLGTRELAVGVEEPQDEDRRRVLLVDGEPWADWQRSEDLLWYRLPSERIEHACLVEVDEASGEPLRVLWAGSEDAPLRSVPYGQELATQLEPSFVPDPRALAWQRAFRRALGWREDRPGFGLPGVLRLRFPVAWDPRPEALAPVELRLEGRPLEAAGRAPGEARARVEALPCPGGWTEDFRARFALRAGFQIRRLPRSLRRSLDLDLAGSALQRAGGAGWRPVPFDRPLPWTRLCSGSGVRVFGLRLSGGSARVYEGARFAGTWSPGQSLPFGLRARGAPLWLEVASEGAEAESEERAGGGSASPRAESPSCERPRSGQRFLFAASIYRSALLEGVDLVADPLRALSLRLALENRGASEPSGHRVLTWIPGATPEVWPSRALLPRPGARWVLPWPEERGGVPPLVVLADPFGHPVGLHLEPRPLSAEARVAALRAGRYTLLLPRAISLAAQQARLSASRDGGERLARLLALLRWACLPWEHPELGRVLPSVTASLPAPAEAAWSGPPEEAERRLPEGLHLSSASR